MSSPSPPTRDDEVSETDPLRLEVAVALAFPRGGMTVSGLRREHKRGNLDFELIAGKQFVTLRDIKQMRQKCRVGQKGHVSTCASDGDAKPCGSSSTERTRSAQVAAQAVAELLNRPSPPTSHRGTDQTGRIVTLRK